MKRKLQDKNSPGEHEKQVLWQQLEQMGCLWSCAKDAKLDDDFLLIEKALLYLEFEDLHKLSALYPMRRIQNEAGSVWSRKATITASSTGF